MLCSKSVIYATNASLLFVYNIVVSWYLVLSYTIKKKIAKVRMYCHLDFF